MTKTYITPQTIKLHIKITFISKTKYFDNILIRMFVHPLSSNILKKKHKRGDSSVYTHNKK